MTKEEVKQWLRSQIDSSLKIQSKHNINVYYSYYNKNYLRVLKLSKINGKPVNKENFKSGEPLFGFNSENKNFWYYYKIRNNLMENYSKNYYIQYKILEEVMYEYDEYKGYKCWIDYD